MEHVIKTSAKEQLPNLVFGLVPWLVRRLFGIIYAIAKL